MMTMTMPVMVTTITMVIKIILKKNDDNEEEEIDDDDDDGSDDDNNNNDDGNNTEEKNDDDEEQKVDNDDDDDDGSDDDEKNIDDEEDFKSSTVYITLSNESESSLCDPRERTDFRFFSVGNTMYGNKILDRTDADINDNESYCFIENLRRRNTFVDDEGDLINNNIFYSLLKMEKLMISSLLSLPFRSTFDHNHYYH